MEGNLVEAQYPIAFRQDDARALGSYIRSRQSVVLIGMKRVGISNFLKFFLFHKNVSSVYIDKAQKHLFAPVDLNDLVEIGTHQFWMLTFKRLLDILEPHDLGKETKKEISRLFDQCMLSKDPFLVLENVRKSLILICSNGLLPTIFFIRFDRIKDFVSPEFFANLQGLRDATGHKLCFVFTSYRSLDCLCPSAFAKTSLSAFSKNLYIKPAKKEDTRIIFENYIKRSGAEDLLKIKDDLFDTVDGYIQYLQLALIILMENKPVLKKNSVFDLLIKDERISLASDELWESLDSEEKSLLEKIAGGGSPNKNDASNGKYLLDTGFLTGDKNNSIFSPIFEDYIRHNDKKMQNAVSSSSEFTKKENLLFSFLIKNLDKICEREEIIKAVWAEVEELGVSDWAIDRLMARVRSKLKSQKSKYEIKTIKTRGYKMVEIQLSRVPATT